MKTIVLAIATTALSATFAAAASVSDFDRNGDRFASFSEVTAANPLVGRNDFRTLDTNRDRRLSSTEVQAPGAEAILNRGIRSVGVVHNTREISGGSFVSESELKATYPGLTSIEFDLVDTNNDNRIGAVELYSEAAQSIFNRYEQGSTILVSLNAVDTDGSGFASLAELQAFYPNLSHADLNFFDSNDDRRISFTEFYSIGAIQVLGKNK